MEIIESDRRLVIHNSNVMDFTKCSIAFTGHITVIQKLYEEITSIVRSDKDTYIWFCAVKVD